MPPSRRLLHELRDWLKARAQKEGVEARDLRFSQRELREHVGWKKTQVCMHVRELVEAEYLIPHVLGPGRRTRYALDWDGQGLEGERFYKGLLDTTTLQGLPIIGQGSGHDRNTIGNRKRGRKASQTSTTPESPPSDRISGERIER